MRTVLFLMRKEFLQILRDRAMLRLLIAVPLVQLLVLGNAATFEIRRARAYLVDEDHSSASRGLVQRLVASGRFQVTATSSSMVRADEALLTREVSLIIHVPAGFERELVRRGTAPVQLVFNAEDGAAAGVLRSHAASVIARYALELGQELQPSGLPALAPRTTSGAGFDVRTRGWYNPESDYSHYMVPGILVLLVTVVATAISSMNIVREKEIGTLEQLNVTPVTKAQFITSKLLPFYIIALVDLALGLAVGRLVFGIPVAGSPWLVFGSALVYLPAALGVGLWVSTIAETQQQAMFLSFAINMVYLLMSGLFTPVASMPEWAQWIAQLSPIKHFIVIMRAVLVKGAGLEAIAAPLLVLLGYGAAVLTLAVAQYRKRTV
jgi:ABC-2 type transport system permease protein